MPKGHLPKEQTIEVVRQLAHYGFKKITFAGGEPTLCPWLSDLIAIAKHSGMTTMIVTNGSKLTDDFLKENQKFLDWIAVSIDSLDVQTNISTGRAITGKTALNLEYYMSLVERIKQLEYGLKINTVVHRYNFMENMNDFIRFAKPERWKVLQVLPVIGQNDAEIERFTISEPQFQTFLDNHNDMKNVTEIVPETNSQITGSYVMVDPAGRFFDNSSEQYNYSKPILEIGVESALQQVNLDYCKFISRGGIYNWER